MKCNESQPACNWLSWIPQTEKSPLSSNEKSKETKPKGKFVGYKHGGFFFFIAQTQYIRAFTKRSSFIHFPCFSSLLSFLFKLKWIFKYFRVFVCECSWHKRKKKRRRRARFDDVSSLMGHWFLLTRILFSLFSIFHVSPSSEFDWKMREKNRKNKRIKEKTRRDREVYRARARHGAIEDEKEKKTKMDWVFSLFSVTDVPLLFRSAKCLSHYTPILSLSLFFSSLWHLILLYPWLQDSVVLWLLLHNYHVHQYTASSIAYQLKWPAVYQKASLFLSRVSNWQSGVAERVCTFVYVERAQQI